jgi:hypothetical protein
MRVLLHHFRPRQHVRLPELVLYIIPIYKMYTVQGNVDNGYRLWIDDVQVINNWKGGYWTGNDGVWTDGWEPLAEGIVLEAGKAYKLYAEYVENWGGQQIRIEWAKNGGEYDGIPDDIFYKEAPAGVPLAAAPAPEPAAPAPAEIAPAPVAAPAVAPAQVSATPAPRTNDPIALFLVCSAIFAAGAVIISKKRYSAK